MNKTIEDIKKQLENFPDDSIVKVYQGEVSGIVILDKADDQIGFIETAGA